MSTEVATTGSQARILDVAKSVIVRRGTRGLTVAEIARLAGVGKGTMYLYWSSKEDLFIDLIARDTLHALSEINERIAADHALVLPGRLFPALLEAIRSHRLLSAVHFHDPELIGALDEHPVVHALIDLVGPDAALRTVMTALSDEGLLRDAVPLTEQIQAAAAVLRGFSIPTDMPQVGGADNSMNHVMTQRVLGDVARRLFEIDEDPETERITQAAGRIHAIMSQAIADARVTLSTGRTAS